MLYLHGGGYAVGSLDSHRGVAARLSQACQMEVLLLDYRLAPEHPFPAALDDAVAAYCWLLQNGLLPQRLVIAGDSAGGGLTLATLLSLREWGSPLPAAAVCISPLTDIEGTGESFVSKATADPWLTPESISILRHYVGTNNPRLPLLSPIYADLCGLPPLLIHVGSDEILLSDSTRLAEQAGATGVEVKLKVWPEMWHVFHCFAPYLPEARQAIEEVGAFVREKV
jgi:acetyl esterase/lipase